MLRIIEKVALSHFFELFYSIKGAEPINNKQATPLQKDHHVLYRIIFEKD